MYQVEIYMLKQTVQRAQMRSVPIRDLHVETNRATCTNEKCTKLRFIYMLKQTVQLAQMRSVPSFQVLKLAQMRSKTWGKPIYGKWMKNPQDFDTLRPAG